MAFEIVCCLSTHDSNAVHHLKPLALHPAVTRLWIVRPRKSLYGEIPNAEYVLTPARFILWRLVQMAWACLRLGARRDVKAFVSFNPIPYGLIAYLAAWWHGKPIHLGFIGNDWTQHSKGKLGSLFLPFFRRADFVTTTGEQMRTEMEACGLRKDRLAAYPHGIDLDRYPVSNPDHAHYTCIFLGELVHLKRVDLILHAMARVKQKHPGIRLCILGRGPLDGDLQRLARELQIDDVVDFLGWQNPVYPYLADSKMILIASDTEGLPFSMVEGMAAGLVPISTPVGSIKDLIIDGENGLLFPVNDAEGLAARIQRLLEDPVLYGTIRANVLATRNHFSYDAATRVWDRWLDQLSDDQVESERSSAAL